MEEEVAQQSIEAPAERTFTQGDLDRVVKREKLAAADIARREMEQKYAEQIRQTQSQGSMGGMQPQVDTDKLYQQVYDRFEQEHLKRQEESDRQNQMRKAEEISQTYFSKMSGGKDIADDFDKITADFNPAAFPQLVHLSHDLDNLPEVIYELSQNPQKLSSLDYLAQRDPNYARNQLMKLSESIKANQMAKQTNKSTMPPLHQSQPSAKVGADNGEMSLKDYKKADWLRV